MRINQLISESPLFNVAKYNIPRNSNYQNLGLPFVGAARQHPSREDRFLLVADPLETVGATQLFEFKTKDLLYVEENSTISADAGSTVPTFTFWLRKGCAGLQYVPFIVGS